MKTLITICVTLLATLINTSAVMAADNIATLRPVTALTQQGEAPPMAKPESNDMKRKRNYPMQPPVIPHNIQDYQVDKNVNKCLSCHARKRAEDSQAPMISVTHYMDRDGNFLADVSPRRYFCFQCHVPQTNAKPMVPNTFKDIDEILKEEGK